MTVRELIVKLKELPPLAEIRVWDDIVGDYYDIMEVHQNPVGKECNIVIYTDD